jgi:3-phenylpropionate/trans-cinnamate dioxygenase ferredoxin reductase subunit
MELDGVLTLRTFEDADRLRDLAGSASHVLVIGGWWIGSEVAASLRQMGARVTFTFAGILPREQALGPNIGRVYDQLHRERGVTVTLRTRIVASEGNGRVRGALTDDGVRLEADLVVTAVGAQPRLELAGGAGLTTSDGVVVDSLLRTSDPAVLAVGDVAQAPYPVLGRSLRLGHWGTAQSQTALV